MSVLSAAIALLVQRALLLVFRSFRPRVPSQDVAAQHRADLMWSLAIGLSCDPLVCFIFHAQHYRLAARLGDAYRLARAQAFEILYLAANGRTRAARQAMEQAKASAEASGHPHAVGLATGMTGFGRYLLGEFREGRALLGRSVELLRNAVGVSWELDNFQLFELECLSYLGDVRELRKRIPPLLQEAEDRGDRYAASMLRTGIQNEAWLATGDVAGARAEVKAAEALWSRQGFHVQHLLHLYANVQIDLYVGDGASALARMQEAWPKMRRSLLLATEFPRICALHLRARAALACAASVQGAERERLLELALCDARRLARYRRGWSNAYALGVRATVAARRGQDGASSQLESAERAFSAVDMAAHAAAMRRRRGEVLGGDEGATLVRAADASTEELGFRDAARRTALLAPGW
jgi:hypothetical protein